MLYFFETCPSITTVNALLLLDLPIYHNRVFNSSLVFLVSILQVYFVILITSCDYIWYTVQSSSLYFFHNHHMTTFLLLPLSPQALFQLTLIFNLSMRLFYLLNSSMTYSSDSAVSHLCAQYIFIHNGEANITQLL